MDRGELPGLHPLADGPWIYRVLNAAGRLDNRSIAPSKKGTGFVQPLPLQAHQHWHVDVSYINVQGTFYFLISVLDGMSRLIVHWDLRESMKEFEIELVLQQGLEKFPGKMRRERAAAVTLALLLLLRGRAIGVRGVRGTIIMKKLYKNGVAGNARRISAHIANIRRKLGRNCIRTRRGYGFCAD